MDFVLSCLPVFVFNNHWAFENVFGPPWQKGEKTVSDLFSLCSWSFHIGREIITPAVLTDSPLFSSSPYFLQNILKTLVKKLRDFIIIIDEQNYAVYDFFMFSYIFTINISFLTNFLRILISKIIFIIRSKNSGDVLK